jgi:hypothetical protein
MRISGITRHAAERFQQRSVPAQIFHLLEEYGDAERSHGCDLLFFSKAAKARIARDWGNEFRHIERWMKVYAVVADSGAVVTVGHRTKRISRH